MISPEKPKICRKVRDEIRVLKYPYRDSPIVIGEEVRVPRLDRRALPF